jgi:UDP-N-acetylglucosamine 2-epimerase (non-hydrolysing)
VTRVRILLVAAARPNFPKVWAVRRGLAETAADVVFVHAGQHYDHPLSQAILDDLQLPPPDVHLETGSGSPAAQTAAVMLAFETVVQDTAPDMVVVVGDVNATLSCAVVAARSPALLAHVEAGLRSGDRSMPEEINRLATDHLSDLLLAPSAEAAQNLAAEGLAARTSLAGNTMVDALDHFLPAARTRPRHPAVPATGRYGVVTLHRPSNVDLDADLGPLLHQLGQVSAACPLILPAHPRVAGRLSSWGLPPGLQVVDALGYLDFLALLDGAAVVLTDSGGVQEETTVLGVPCVTLRTTTERRVTITEGTNRLAPPGSGDLAASAVAALDEPRRPCRPEGWDGRAGERIATTLVHAAEHRT